MPIEEFVRWGEEVARESDLEERHKSLQASLRDLARRPEVMEAVFLASPGLFERLAPWLENNGNEKEAQIGLAAARYVARMSARCTPFGLFAGISIGQIGEGQHQRLQAQDTYTRRTRLDMDYLSALIQQLNQRPELRECLTFVPNSSLYRAAGRARYYEARMQGRKRNYFLIAAELDDALTETLSRAKDGCSREELIDGLAGEFPRSEAVSYIDELIDSQLLVSTLAPNITGAEALPVLVEQLDGLEAAETETEVLAHACTCMAEFDTEGVGIAPQRYLDLAARLRNLSQDTEISRLFQVDLCKPAGQVRLPQRVVDELLAGTRLLHDLFSARNDDGWEAFRHAYRQRYGDVEMPLAEVLDEETGIGFEASRAPGAEPSPLLEGLLLEAPPRRRMVPMDAVHSFLQWRVTRALEAGDREIRLTDAEIRELRESARKGSPLPDAFAVLASLWRSDRAPGFELHISSVGGPSGARLLGRFCHLDDGLRENVREHLASEEALRPDAVFFEIVHLPENRIGNILARPQLRTYEFAFLGRSGAKVENQLALEDLFVSVSRGRVRLRSKRLGCEVVPRLSSAHNTSRHTTGIYRFLAALQKQDVTSGLSWDWGPLSDMPYLPRVGHGALILAPQTWRFRVDELQGLQKLSGPALFAKFREWLGTRGLPRYVGLVDADNILPLDLENSVSVESFWDVVKRRRSFCLQETLPQKFHDHFFQGPEGHFASEIIVPFVRKAQKRTTVASQPVPEPRIEQHAGPAAGRTVAPRETLGPNGVARVLPPGTDWLYARIYAGVSDLDRVLLNVVAPLVRRHYQKGTLEKWFFIRYPEPNWHLRLRCQGSSELLYQRFLPELSRVLKRQMEDHIVWRLQFDTYERELWRYGGPEAIETCESIFQADSEAVVDVLSNFRGDEALDARWRLTLKGLDALLDDLGFDLLRKFQLMDRVAHGFGREFDFKGLTKKQVLERFRKERGFIEQFLGDPSRQKVAAKGDGNGWSGTGNGAGIDSLLPGLQAFEARSRAVAAEIKQIRDLAREGLLSISLEDLGASLLHMHVNRMLRSAQRAHELVLYQLLARHYDSQLAQRGIKGKQRQRLLAELQTNLPINMRQNSP